MGKNSCLLSIIIPTKNRYECLKSFIKLIASFENDDIELVIQDNSDNNVEFGSFLKTVDCKNLVYKYNADNLSVIQNSELAIKNSTGKYVCFMGDDDLLSSKLYEFVKWMDCYEYDSAIFEKAFYSWPGVEYKAHKFPNLKIPKWKGKLEHIEVDKEFKRLLSEGATSLGKTPQLYHGVILRKRLDEIYQRTGTYFPGPSPDMAISIALCYVVKRHLYCAMPYVSSGKSLKSAAGLGAKHMHKDELKNLSFLPIDTEEKWEKEIPKIWTGPTIYAESALKSMKAMEKEFDAVKFNYSFFYAFFYVYCYEYHELLKGVKYNCKNFNKIKYLYYICLLFVKRCIKYMQNKISIKIHFDGESINEVRNSFDAQQIIDQRITNVEIEKMFTDN